MQDTADNLDKLAGYIEEHVPQKNLDMANYRALANKTPVSFESHENCGTVGCALGWSPFHPDMPPLDEHYSGAVGVLMYDYYGVAYYPDLYGSHFSKYDWTHDWKKVFHMDLSSDKEHVVGRLREMAARLRGTPHQPEQYL